MKSDRKHAPPERFTVDEKNHILHWHRKTWPSRWNGDGRGRKSWLEQRMAACLDWHHAEGRSKWKADYVRAAMVWIRKDMDGWKMDEPKSSSPNRTGKRPFEKRTKMVSVASELPPMLREMLR